MNLRPPITVIWSLNNIYKQEKEWDKTKQNEIYIIFLKIHTHLEKSNHDER